MSIAKVIEVVASSENGFEDAVRQGLTKASQTIHGISGVHVKNWTADVQNDQIVNFKVAMDIAFRVDD